MLIKIRSFEIDLNRTSCFVRLPLLGSVLIYKDENQFSDTLTTDKFRGETIISYKSWEMILTPKTPCLKPAETLAFE